MKTFITLLRFRFFYRKQNRQTKKNYSQSHLCVSPDHNNQQDVYG